MKDVYNKLVHDKIPDLIAAGRSIPTTETLDDAAYFQALNLKLQEEVAEYLDGFSVEEIADILEVIRAIIDYKAISYDDVERIRKVKYDERGGFSKKSDL